MNFSQEISFIYIFIDLFLAGFTICSLIVFIYLYISSMKKEIPGYILFGLSAVFYVAGDSAALIIYQLTSDYKTARFFVAVRELSALVCIIAIPYVVNRLLVFKRRLHKINRNFGRGAVVSAAIITILTIYNYKLLLGGDVIVNSSNMRMIVVIDEIKPLFMVKTALMILYLIYGILVISYSKINNRVRYPVAKMYASLLVLTYFILSGLFYVIFFNGKPGYIGYDFPYISSGVGLFALLNMLSLFDVLVDYAKKLLKIEKELKNIVYEDKDTGLPNRNGFINDLQWELLIGNPVSLIFIDVDDFQNINELYGEKTGDEILKLFSGRIIDFFSNEGKLYRIGGDDFVLMLKEPVTDEKSGTIAKKIISSLRNPFRISGVSHMLTASIGIIQSPRDGDVPHQILNNAYSVIRNAKQTKNTYRIFSRAMAENSSKRIGIVNLLRASINSDQFELYYQPVVDSSGNLVYAESLLRCTNPDPEIGGPGDFIPLMEKAGLIKDIDDMVIRKAYHDMEVVIKKRFGISINLSSNQLVNPAYSDFLYSFSVQHGVDPSMITFEVIENTLIENLDAGRESILRLKEKGFKIAIDDFGKGYSSLSYISELPIDIIKIDMTFVQSVPGDQKKEAIVAGIIKLAHSIGLKTVAEGFETAEQFEFFRSLGCDNFQGFYFSHPLPLDELQKKYSSLKLTEKDVE